MPSLGDGYCECGCGGKTSVSDRTHTQYGHVKGQPMRFIRGHAMKGKNLSPESREAISKAHKGKNTSDATKAKMRQAQLGPKGHNWRGGKTMREGRQLVYVGRDHPLADVYGYAYEHRLKASEREGRMLGPTEHVHHRDLNPLNNEIDNLLVLTRGQHRRLHNLLKKGHTTAEAERIALS